MKAGWKAAGLDIRKSESRCKLYDKFRVEFFVGPRAFENSPS